MQPHGRLPPAEVFSGLGEVHDPRVALVKLFLQEQGEQGTPGLDLPFWLFWDVNCELDLSNLWLVRDLGIIRGNWS